MTSGHCWCFLEGLDLRRALEAFEESGTPHSGKIGCHCATDECLETFEEIVPDIPEHDWHRYVLLCLKPVYGLSEAPLAWQLFLHQFLRELGGIPSHFDECFYYWPAKKPGMWPTASLSTHVDDLAARGKRKWLDETYAKMLAKFGKLTRQTLPFVHCGCQYTRIKDGFKVDQSEYVMMLQPAPIKPDDDMDRNLIASEITVLRSLIGGLMWTSITRPDVLAELSTLQSVMNKAKVCHLKMANDLIARAKTDKEAAIYYRALQPTRYRIVVIHDASAATSTKNYRRKGSWFSSCRTRLTSLPST